MRILISASHLILLLKLCSCLAAQESIDWTPGALSWKLYKEQDQGSGNQLAFSYVGIEYSVYDVDGRPAASYNAIFRSDQSWVKSGSASSALLHHEQKLFDLCELYARKMRRQISIYIMNNSDSLTVTKVLPEVKRVYMNTMNEFLQKIQIYNSETLNGKNAKGQQKWNKFIDTELEKLEMFRLIGE